MTCEEPIPMSKPEIPRRPNQQSKHSDGAFFQSRPERLPCAANTTKRVGDTEFLICLSFFPVRPEKVSESMPRVIQNQNHHPNSTTISGGGEQSGFTSVGTPTNRTATTEQARYELGFSVISL